MEILNGKKIADEILDDLQDKIKQEDLHPGLGVVLVGSDEASQIYFNLKGKAAEKAGIVFRKIGMDEKASESEVLAAISRLNADPGINGIIVQLPLPGHLDKIKIIQAIDPEKDVDGFHEENIDLFFAGRERFFPVFPGAILELLKSAGEKLENKEAAIICNSQEFGKAMRLALGREVVAARYFFRDDIQDNSVDLKDFDIVITACGAPGLVRGEMLRGGAIVIDGGITKLENKVLGDVDFDSVKDLPGYLSPVPGGVGPVTIACLLRNVYLAARIPNKNK
ncbi:MAG: bifunctional 5,10-methylenetetrahydrofolate dehydrogenase/5,10-methenyltetrahydrofolate cyclohydrolase [Candidatus Moranbacteria bacterium]|nr:bifunctional 5,10-methylenetetrahydrofolate dehydrogenase/5,10-methenyltetrahydrofolate cyclohydrolase [Candidatus Moranbacteria bacterium]